MADGLGVAVRFVLYLDLALLCGVPLFLLHSFQREWADGERGLEFGAWPVAAAIIGILLAALNLALLAQSMSGTEQLTALRFSTLAMVVGGTHAGLAGAARIGALLLALWCVVRMKRRSVAGLWVVAGCAFVALASLAWSGHAAMDDGVRGYVHLWGDIVHLFAVAGWVGALAVFAKMSWPSTDAADRRARLLSRGLTGFAGLGTIIVVALMLTGVANYGFIVGPSVDGLLSSPYGLLLLAKLGLFVAMLGLAAANRFRLAPRLAASIAAGRPGTALVLMRRSVALEAGTATVILLLVAWLGTLGPPTGS